MQDQNSVEFFESSMEAEPSASDKANPLLSFDEILPPELDSDFSQKAISEDYEKNLEQKNSHLIGNVDDPVNDFQVLPIFDASWASQVEVQDLQEVTTKESIYEQNSLSSPQNQIIKKYRKAAQKNSLQFYSNLIMIFFENKLDNLSEEERKMLLKIKDTPSIVCFDELFKFQGPLRIHLSQFFHRKNLTKMILGSKVRRFQFKRVYISIGNRLRVNFIKGQLKSLSTSSQ